MMRTIDCRNMACPAPVVTTRKALEEVQGQAVEILVDGGAPRENVTRFASSRGYAVTEKAIEGGFSLTIGNLEEGGVPAVRSAAAEDGAVLLITSDRFGDGPEELGRLLMKNYLITLLDLPETPRRMFFINTGVLLTTEGSEGAEPLAKLAEQGVEIRSCGVCLDFFHRKERLVVGGVTTMYTIAEALQNGAKVIRL